MTLSESGRSGCGRSGAVPRGPRVAVVAVVLLGLCALLPVPTGTAAADTRPGSYDFAPGDRAVAGAADTSKAGRLDPGHTYRSSLPRNGRLYYRLRLTAPDTAYVPVTAVPPANATVSSTDGIRVSVRDGDGTPCSFASARFGAGQSPRPVTALAQREAGKALCQGAGTYYLLVERLDTQGSGAAGPTGTGDPAQRWDLEIAPATEPRPARTGPTTAPRAWDSATPEPPTGEPRARSGGAGFASAEPVGQGVWRTALVPGETRFYKVPLDWGRRIHASAELGASPGRGYVGGALTLALHNPARGCVDDAALGYTGVRKSIALEPLPPVEYANRYAAPAGVSSVRFAGEYYLVLHLSEKMAPLFGQGPFDVTLRVGVDGRAHAGPDYTGPTEPADLFTVTVEGRETARTGAAGEPDGTTTRLVAVGGFGLGTALLLALGGWTVAARRTQRRVSAQKPTA
ncbi:hypothetical protein ACGFX8_30765 [Streptomyces sp. NPDC048362]|uniref:hypothetical protein n=1 Tax=Streptomyces sp. NPDC048362 TaxID=3365539 RepID=UPI00371C34D9